MCHLLGRTGGLTDRPAPPEMTKDRILFQEGIVLVDKEGEFERHVIVAQDNIARIFERDAEDLFRTAMKREFVLAVHLVREEIERQAFAAKTQRRSDD